MSIMIKTNKKAFTLMRKASQGFTLIELLVTMMIIGILVTIATFGIRQAQQSARDGRRKVDLENIASALELYRAECNRYPQTSRVTFGSNLTGTGSGNCAAVTYMKLPNDPQPGSHGYSYSTDALGATYNLCASLELPPSTTSTSGCGSCTGGCDWKVSKP
jgi:prepilin-type N-terminal cleavage/methylation domain-containing protein